MALQQLARKIAQRIAQKPFDAALIVVISAAFIKLSSLYFSVNADDGNWNQFKTEHHCQLRTNASGTQRSSWVCDDGKTYYRWRQQR